METKKTIAAFDFDGTITTKDTLWEFLKFSQSKRRLYSGIVFLSPVLLLYLLKIISNNLAKEILFSYFFKNWDLSHFNDLCDCFSEKIDCMLNEKTTKIIEQHKSNGHPIYIVSASMENWITPWAQKKGLRVIATQLQINSDLKLTGKFKTKNCYGQEKVNRLLEVMPNRSEYFLMAYGDSRGDREMLKLADKGLFV